MKADTATETIARAFVAARRDAQALVSYPAALPTSLDAAYAIQDMAIGHMDQPIAGWKVGRIGKPFADGLGVDRLAGPIFAKSVQQICDGAGRIFSAGFGAIEAEFVFRLHAPPAPGKTQFSLEDASSLVDAVYLGFEIASSPYPGINSQGPLVTISDFGNNNGLILGPEIPDWRSGKLDDWQVEMRIDGALVGTGQASAFDDGPLGSVRFLLENLVQRGIAVAPGTLVSSGAVTGVHEVRAGQHAEARFGDNAVIDCTIAGAEPY